MKKKPEIFVYTLGVGCTAKGVGNFGPFGLVSLTKMKNPGPIGSAVDEKNTTGPNARILFATAASVESLIAELKPVARKMRAFDRAMARVAKQTKKQMKRQGTEIIIDASTNSALRYPDEQRKLPRKRAKR